MSWRKINLVTQKNSIGMYDEYECSECGFRKKYYSLVRNSCCPKCKKGDSIDIPVYGCWGSLQTTHECQYCHSILIICPKENHPNSRFWYLKQTEKEGLFICPNGCYEDGKGIHPNGKIRRLRRR